MSLLPQISTYVSRVHSILPTQMALTALLINVRTLPTCHRLPSTFTRRLNDDRRGLRVVTTTAFTVVSLRTRLWVVEQIRRVAAGVSVAPPQAKRQPPTRMRIDVSSHLP